MTATAGPRARRALTRRVAVAALVWIAAFAATVLLRDYLQRANFALFWISILFAAWYVGWVAALIAAFASVVAAELFLVQPFGEFAHVSASTVVTFAIFLVTSGLVSLLAASRARAERESAGYAEQLEEQAIELEQQMEEAKTLADELSHTNDALEVALRSSEHSTARVFAVLDTLNDAVVRYDAEWRIQYANPAARQALAALGIAPNEEIGTAVWDLVPTLRGSRFEAEMRRAVSERCLVDFEEYEPTIGRWLESRIVPGDDRTVTTFSRDVTVRRRALEAERAAADRARRLLAVTSGLSVAVTASDVADVIFRDGLAAIGADAGSLALVRRAPNGEGANDESLDGAQLEVVRTHGYSEPLVEAYRTFPLRAGRPLSDAVLSGEPLLLSSADAWIDRYGSGPADPRSLGYEAFVAIPVSSAGRVLAGMSASFRERVRFDDATRTLIATLGEQCGLALARAEAYEAEQRARAIAATMLGSLRDAFVAFDADFRYTYVNARAGELLRRSATELIGRVLWDVVPATGHTPFGDALRRVHASRLVQSVEAYSPVAECWLEARVYPSSDGGTTMFFEDVSERRRLQQSSAFLAEASRLLTASLDFEHTLRAVAQAAVPELGDWCAVDIVLDPTSGAWPPKLERLAVVHQDPSKVQLAADIAQRYPTDWNAPTGMPRVLRHREPLFLPRVDDAMLVAGARDATHLETLRALHFSSIMVVPLVARDVTLGALTLVMSDSGRRYDSADLHLAQDLANRAATAVDNARLFREAERARRDAEWANRAKSQFLSTMSHELRTPLNAITGYTELLEMGIRGPVTEVQREDLSRIRRSANVLMSLVTDVLNFARVEAGKVDFRVETVTLDDTLADLETLVAPQVRAKGLRYALQLCEPTVLVRADVDRLKQILTNLLTNAVKFTGEGGTITVSCEARERVACVHVRDTGRGIPADNLEAIFEPFVQLDRHLTHESQQGVGLGLAISRELARGMGGDLLAESVVGVGSTFTLTLPRHHDAATESSANDGSGSASA